MAQLFVAFAFAAGGKTAKVMAGAFVPTRSAGRGKPEADADEERADRENVDADNLCHDAASQSSASSAACGLLAGTNQRPLILTASIPN